VEKRLAVKKKEDLPVDTLTLVPFPARSWLHHSQKSNPQASITRLARGKTTPNLFFFDIYFLSQVAGTNN
jgi:hypothetical protein